MKAKKLLVTLGASFAMAAALASCGFDQNVERYKTIDLTGYADSYWQEGKANDYNRATYEYTVGSDKDATLSADAAAFAIPYKTEKDELGNNQKVEIDASKIEGVKSISYTYYLRNGLNSFNQFSKNIKADEDNAGVTSQGVPTKAGEYWCVAHFNVDTDRYYQPKDWVSKVNVYHESPYTSADFSWADGEYVYEDNTTYGLRSKAKLADVEFTVKNDRNEQSVSGLTGIKGYSYTFVNSSNLAVNAGDISAIGVYTGTFTLYADNFYKLPVLQSGQPEGKAQNTIRVTNPGAGRTVTYQTAHGTAPEQVTNAVAFTNAMLPTITATGYDFGGWYLDEAFTTAAQVGELVEGNTTLYAKWTTNKLGTWLSALDADAEIVLADDFNQAEEFTHVDDDAWMGTKGINYRRNLGSGKTWADSDKNFIQVTDGELELVNNNSNGGTQAILDFGTTYTGGVVSGTFDIRSLSTNSQSITAIQFFGKKATSTNGEDRYSGTSEFFGIRANSKVWSYRVDGSSEVTAGAGNLSSVGTTYTFSFVLDIDNKTLVVKADGNVFAELTNFDVTEFSAIRIASGDGNTATWFVDNVGIAYKNTMTVDTVKASKLAALETAFGTYETADYGTAEFVEIVGAYNTGKAAIEAATTIEAVNAAYNTAISAMSSVEKKPTTEFAVTYSCSVAGVELPAATQASELTAAMLPQLTADGYVFVGWYKDAAFTTAAEAGDALVAATILYAKFDETMFTQISNSSSKLYVNDFSTATTIPAFTGEAGTYVSAAGLSQRLNEKNGCTDDDRAKNGAVVENGVLSLKNGSTLAGTQIVYDFGRQIKSGKLSITVDLNMAAAFGADQQPIQFYGTSELATPTSGSTPYATTIGDIFGIRAINNSKSFQYRVNGDKTNGVSSLTGTGYAANTTYTFTFVFDFDAKTLVVTMNGKEFASLEGITSLAQMRIATGDGNTEEFTIDNLAIGYTANATYTTAAEAAIVGGAAGIYMQVQDTDKSVDPAVTSTLEAADVTEKNQVTINGNNISIIDTDGDASFKDGATTFAYVVNETAINAGVVTYEFDVDMTGATMGSKWNFISLFDENGTNLLSLRTCGVTNDVKNFFGYSLDGGTTEHAIGTAAMTSAVDHIKITIDYTAHTATIEFTEGTKAALTATFEFTATTGVKAFRFMTGAQADNRSFKVSMPVVKVA